MHFSTSADSPTKMSLYASAPGNPSALTAGNILGGSVSTTPISEESNNLLRDELYPNSYTSVIVQYDGTNILVLFSILYLFRFTCFIFHSIILYRSWLGTVVRLNLWNRII